MEHIKELKELCATIMAEIADANLRIRTSGGKISAGLMDYIDKLTHSLKSIKAVIAMLENAGEDHYQVVTETADEVKVKELRELLKRIETM